MEKKWLVILRYRQQRKTRYTGWKGNASSEENAVTLAKLSLKQQLGDNAWLVLSTFRISLRKANKKPAEWVYDVLATDIEEDFVSLLELIKENGEMLVSDICSKTGASEQYVMILLGLAHARIGVAPGTEDYFAYTLAKKDITESSAIREPGLDIREDIMQALSKFQEFSFDNLWKYTGSYRKEAFAFCLGWLLGKGKIKISKQGWKVTHA